MPRSRDALVAAAIAATLIACHTAPAAPAAPAAPVAADATTGPGAATAPAPAAPALRQVAAETTVTTAWSATLAIPASWWIAEEPGRILVEDPEREARLGFVVSTAADRDAAIAEAWQRIEPGFARAVAQADELPARDGWDAVAQVVYVVPAEASRAVVAVARRLGATWHVTTIDGSLAALGRRGAQLNAIIVDMKVPGLAEESFAGKPAQLDRAHLDRFAAFVEAARQRTGVPGVAIAVVHGGAIVLERGLGTRVIGGKLPVTPSTRFMIGSTTKSLTTLLLARLIDQGKLAWDTPVVDALPGFALADPDVTRQVQVKHTVCACTGMPRQDLEFLFEYAGWDPARRLASLATMKPTTGFGETFQYSNLMVAAGGWIGARAFAPKLALGPGYDQAMAKLVFGPLGMKSTTFDARQAQRGDHARSHGQTLDLAWVETPLAYEDAVSAVRPAGAAWSSARDLALYLLLELAHGKTARGQQLVSAANLDARRAPQVKIDEDNAYGLGLFVTDDHGVTVIHHGGNMLGFTSDLFFLPDHDVGVVVLTNAGAANTFRGAVRRAFLEIVLDGKPEAQANLDAALELTARHAAEERARLAAPDDAWIGPLLGGYDDPALGHVELRRAPGPGPATYLLDAGEWTSTVVRKTDRDGTVLLATTQPPYLGLELQPRVDGGRTVLVLDAGQQVYTFTPSPRP